MQPFRQISQETYRKRYHKGGNRHDLRREIVRLMAIRATLTARSNAEEWAKVDKQICELQAKLDNL